MKTKKQPDGSRHDPKTFEAGPEKKGPENVISGQKKKKNGGVKIKKKNISTQRPAGQLRTHTQKKGKITLAGPRPARKPHRFFFKKFFSPFLNEKSQQETSK